MAKEMTGVLFKNDKRENPKAPVYKGQCMLNGVEFWISAWINEHEEHGKYMSLKFDAKQAKEQKAKGDYPF